MANGQRYVLFLSMNAFFLTRSLTPLVHLQMLRYQMKWRGFYRLTRHACEEIFLAAFERKIMSLKEAELYIHSSGLFQPKLQLFPNVFG